MITSPWYRSLPVQILVLLSLAVLPLGAISIYQTTRVAEQAERNAELALLNITASAAKAEELIIERAFGAARFFATTAEDFITAPERCVRDLGRFIENNPRYSLIGILPKSGLMTCTSTGGSFDFSGYPNFDAVMADPNPTIVVNQRAPLSGTSVFVISEPFEIDGVFEGYISVSVPHSGLPDELDSLNDLGLEELITFNESGDILTARSDITSAAEKLPATVMLSDLSAKKSDAFSALNQNGERRTYTVVPIEGSPASALGIWRSKRGLASEVAGVVQPAVFPILMWMASLAVAMLSVYMLVLRHLGRLRSEMDGFSRDRSLPDFLTDTVMPNEIHALRRNFADLTRGILEDEARLEDVVREKGVLVKEIHHRVKNNLQLISSIMNMQIRSAEHEETRRVISSLQDRVRSLATIHRDLYQSQEEGRVNAGALVSEILDHSMEMTEDVTEDRDIIAEVDPVFLYPDQAVPLSLLVAEAMTNTLKYLGHPTGQKPWIVAKLNKMGSQCTFTLANSVGQTIEEDSTGLGSDLINAFAIQLGGKITIDNSGGRYEMQVTFPIADFVPESKDF